mgnify:CR=1 FL=1
MKRKEAMAMVAAMAVGSLAVPVMAEDGAAGGKIGISMPTQSLERWNRDGSYLQKQFEDTGYEVELTYSDNETDRQVNDIQNLISDGVNLLVVAAIDGEALNTVMDEAADAGIPVISYDRLIKSDAVSYYISFDNYTVGTLQGQYVVDTLDLDNAGDKTYNIEFTAGDPADNNAGYFFNGAFDVLKPYIGDYDEKRVKFLVCQEVEDEMEKGEELLEELIDYVASFERKPISVSKLIIGMKCGGSDGFSGITANPLVGRFSDLLISKKGTTILTEVPEMFGAETILMNRCENEQLFDKTVELINDFKQYFKDNHQTIYENPSPGNKKGGISTLEDKSLGCTQKSGNAPVKGVLAYGEPVVASGLNLLSAPGNDLVAATALAASGAHIVLFTTGRGTPFASPVPTVKISSNSSLAGRKKNWIDFNAGVLVEDQELDETAQKLFDYVVEVASGKKVCSEEAGFHDMAIFKQGVTL